MRKLFFSLALVMLFGAVLVAGTVQGYVTDSVTGEPIENAKVHFTTNDGQHICFDAYTDENGFYSMDILNETYNGRALKRREYRVTLIENIEIGDGITTIDFVLEPTIGTPRIIGFNHINNNGK
jgi:carboxypeptidase family protein